MTLRSAQPCDLQALSYFKIVSRSARADRLIQRLCRVFQKTGRPDFCAFSVVFAAVGVHWCGIGVVA